MSVLNKRETVDRFCDVLEATANDLQNGLEGEGFRAWLSSLVLRDGNYIHLGISNFTISENEAEAVFDMDEVHYLLSLLSFLVNRTKLLTRDGATVTNVGSPQEIRHALSEILLEEGSFLPDDEIMRRTVTETSS